MALYSYQEGNLIMVVNTEKLTISANIDELTVEMSVAQWHRLYSKVNDLVFNLVVRV